MQTRIEVERLVGGEERELFLPLQLDEEVVGAVIVGMGH